MRDERYNARTRHLVGLIGRVSYLDQDWRLGQMGDGHFVQITYLEPDVFTGKVEEQRGRKWYISPHAIDSEVVQTMLAAALASAEHRVREHFKVDGRRPFKPHFDVDALAALDANSPDVHRAPMPAKPYHGHD